MTAQHSESSEDVLAGTLHGRPRAVIRKALLAFARPLLGLRIFGEGNVPTSGALLVVSNHVSNADPPFLELAFPRPLFFMGKSELFRNRPLGWLLRRFGGFPVARGTPDRAALRFAEAVLRQEVAMGIFPEGGRSTSGALGRGYAGVGLLALRSAAPILPVAIYGTEYYPVNGVMPPRRTICVCSPGSVKSARITPDSSSQTMVPGGTSTVKSLPFFPCRCWLRPGPPFSALNRVVKRNGTRLVRFGLALM